MDKFPLLWDGRPSGELRTEQEALYTWFAVRCRLPKEGLWCAWAVGEGGELRLGVLEPSGEQATLRRRFSKRMTAPLGVLLRGELRAAGEVAGGTWLPVQRAETLFQTPWLRRHLSGLSGVMTKEERGLRWVAVPYRRERPFPLAPVFCFARRMRIGREEYLAFAFDRNEWPRFE